MLFVSHNLLEDLGLVLCVAAVTSVVFQVIRQPVVVGYLVAGMVVGPHVPIPLLADSARIQMLSELGVILLMFALGLEFSLRKLLRLGPTASFVTALQVGLMIWLGFIVGRAMGWTPIESIFVGAVISISSTTIIARALAERPVGPEVRELVFGVALAEDLAAVMLLAILTAVASGVGLSARMMAATAGRLALFLIALIGGGMVIVPRLMRRIVALDQAETTLVASVGICFAFAVVAERTGYSVALGAFLAGSLVAESGAVEIIGRLVDPVRDLFAAIFFVSVGMMIDPAQIAAHWFSLAVLTIVVIAGKVAGVSIAAMLSGISVSTAVQAGLCLAQIGEFSFIIAGVGTGSHATRDFLYTLAVAVSAITTFLTPFLIRASEPLAEFLARHEPRSLLPLRTMYDGVMTRARSVRLARSEIGLASTMLGAAGCAIAAILILNEADPLDLTGSVVRFTGLSYFRAGLLVDVGALVACLPFAIAMYTAAGKLADSIARRAMTPGAVKTETLRAIVAVIRATLLLVVVMPILALVQPFVEPLEGIGAMIIGMVWMSIVIWRAARAVRGQLGEIGTLLSGGGVSAAPEQ